MRVLINHRVLALDVLGVMIVGWKGMAEIFHCVIWMIANVRVTNLWIFPSYTQGISTLAVFDQFLDHEQEPS